MRKIFFLWWKSDWNELFCKKFQLVFWIIFHWIRLFWIRFHCICDNIKWGKPYITNECVFTRVSSNWNRAERPHVRNVSLLNSKPNWEKNRQTNARLIQCIKCILNLGKKRFLLQSHCVWLLNSFKSSDNAFFKHLVRYMIFEFEKWTN